ncbi:MAG TPA: uroporphyrinogen-III C-methyltransferase [Nitrospiraceae bacterium]|nr:uroporphyrinogen-III C-methyltransferase [Nitrospiraceae bacterium]
MTCKPGKVYLVGAGPGDPKLLTLRGKECLEQADVVLYDYLANPVLLDYAPARAERIYVGRRGRGTYPDQGEINRLLIDKTKAGKIVVRLKGGDPFVFGRGGEEAEAVAEAGLDFEVVPGVTAAVAVPAYAGIPVTHRTLASTVAFVTGHEDPTKGPSKLEWPRLATAQGTLVFLMGMKNLPTIVSRLIAEGRAADTPVAVIRWGTRANQRTIVGTLSDIVQRAEEAGMEPPTVIVVGEVVRLRQQLNWFEKRPLFGKRILVTRAREQAADLSNLLAAYGGEPVECPTIQIVPPESWDDLDQALAELDHYRWLIFTSVNGVGPFMARLAEKGRDARALAGLSICCIGPRTAKELAVYGLKADLVPSEYQAEGVIDALRKAGVKGQNILIPRAAVAREILPEQLRALGAEVRVVTAYRTVMPKVDVQHLREQFQQRRIDVITFTSSSTVRNFSRLFDDLAEMKKATEGAVVACIGPITAETARELGFAVNIVAGENTVPALAQAIVRHFADERGPGQRRCTVF